MDRDRRNKKARISFKEYCSKIEELLKLVGRDKKKKEKISPDSFIL